MLKQHTYDGLGRLIKTQSPFPDPDTAPITGQVRSERFYYDGIRRIQELVTDPVLSQGAAGGSGDPELEGLAGGTGGGGQEGTDPEGAGTPLENGQLDQDGITALTAVGWMPNGLLAREYIWGPGDWHSGVDELLVQYDPDRKPWWAIQDAGGDLVALVETPGTSSSSTQPAQVAGQWTYDAYGACRSFDLLTAHAAVHCGHKGLFFDRLDVGVVSISGTAITENDRLSPGAELSGYARNRHYLPRLGRWLQRDPNACGNVLIDSLNHHGHADSAMTSPLDLASIHSDGASLYQYVRSTPHNGIDPLGLLTDEDAEDALDVINLLFITDDPVNAVPRPSDFIRAAASALVQGYADNMGDDFNWAMDWSRQDDDYSRLDNDWMPYAIGIGLYHAFDINIPFTDGATINPLAPFAPEMASEFRETHEPRLTHEPRSRAREPRVRGGESIHASNGRLAHIEYETACAKSGIKGPEWKFEQTERGIGRFDAINKEKRIIRELKPNTPSGRVRGVKQLATYLALMEQRYGGTWTGILDFYDPW